jgi:hypothetical protein
MRRKVKLAFAAKAFLAKVGKRRNGLQKDQRFNRKGDQCQPLLRESAGSFPLSFGRDIWGITASDSSKGYKIYVEIKQFEAVDGAVAPCAAGGS